jgi:hypothetical protein
MTACLKIFLSGEGKQNGETAASALLGLHHKRKELRKNSWKERYLCKRIF